MKSPMLHAIRQRVIEGRRQTLGQNGRYVNIPTLGIRVRLLEHPSNAPHYVASLPADSGVWRSQKTTELIKEGRQQIWSCERVESIHRRVPKDWTQELKEFLDLVYKEEIGRIWLDTCFRFWNQEWSKWSFDYKSEGNFDLYQGTAKVFRRDIHVYTGICSAGTR